MMKQTKRNLKRRYSQSRAMRLAIWLYAMGFMTFAVNFSSFSWEPIWQFGRDYYDVMIALTMVVTMPLWLCLYALRQQSQQQFKRDHLCYQWRCDNYKLLELCLSPTSPEQALQQMAQAIRNIDVYGEDDEKAQARHIADYIAHEAGYQFDDVITLLKITRRYMRDMLDADHPNPQHDNLYLLQLPDTKKNRNKKKPAL